MPIKVKVETADMSTVRNRRDWSDVRARLADLQLGTVLQFTCPKDMEVPQFRSTLIMIGKRAHSNWRVAGRTEGRVVKVFLAAK